MAPYLSAARRVFAQSLIKKGFKNKVIASAVQCNRRTVQRIRCEQAKMATSTPNPVGRPSTITPAMRAGLREMLDLRSDLERDEIQSYFEDKWNVKVSKSAIGRALESMNWTRKVSRRVAQQQDPDLRDRFLHIIAKFDSWQLVFVDESGCNKDVGHRRYGWAPRGITPRQKKEFTRGRRWNILPAYWQGGIIKSWVYQGSTNTHLFDLYIEQLLQHCGRYPEPKSVLVMDNASWHFSPKMMQMCADAGVLVVELSPYSPDFNPIEEYFGVLKRFIRKNWYRNREFVRREIKMYLEWCVDVVGSRSDLAEAQFRHARIHVQPPPS